MRNYIFIFFIGLSSKIFAQDEFKIFFNSNDYQTTKAENTRLNQWILNNKTSKILSISGYCDEDGSVVYNDSLAKKRVDFVYNLIKNSVKIRDDFKTINFGKNHQQSAIKAENRRVVIYYLTKENLTKETELIKLATSPADTTSVIPKTKNELPENATLEQKIEHTKIGETIVLKNINFHLNTFAIVNDSRKNLYELFDVMHRNPKLRIEIQGHVCCNPNPDDKHSLKLSTERAKAIKLFLLAYGIESYRVTFKGFGSSKPIFTIPEQNETERAENRRVEILIVEK